LSCITWHTHISNTQRGDISQYQVQYLAYGWLLIEHVLDKDGENEWMDKTIS
jgi:hypothetical protein